MAVNLTRLLGFGSLIVIALGLTAPHAHSEIAVTGGQLPPIAAPIARAPAPATESPTQAQALWVQCWQDGVKIIDEKNIFGIRLRNLIEQETIGFSGRDSNNGNVYIIPVNDVSTCLVKSLR